MPVGKCKVYRVCLGKLTVCLKKYSNISFICLKCALRAPIKISDIELLNWSSIISLLNLNEKFYGWHYLYYICIKIFELIKCERNKFWLLGTTNSFICRICAKRIVITSVDFKQTKVDWKILSIYDLGYLLDFIIICIIRSEITFG